MAKRRKPHGSPARDPQQGYATKVDRLFRRIGVPSIRNGGTLQRLVETVLPEDQVPVWLNQASSRNRLVLSSPEAAISLGIGFREQLLKPQIAWIVSEVARMTPPDATALVLDVGAGTGITAACVNTLTQATVIATDIDPSVASVIPAVAAKINAQVEVTVVDAAHAPEALNGHTPTVVLSQALLAYAGIQHRHHPGMDWEAAIARRLTDPEDLGPQVGGLLTAAHDATLLVVDFACPEIIASLIAHAARHHLQADLGSVQHYRMRIEDFTEEQRGIAFHPVTLPRLPTAADLLNALEVRNSRPPAPGVILTGWNAEKAYRDLPAPTRAYRRVNDDGTEAELLTTGSSGTLSYGYWASSDGPRQITFKPASHAAQVEAEITSEIQRDQRGGWQEHKPPIHPGK